ncbi:MAG: family 1 glycosylhydrolase [bacterium]
MDKQKSIFNKNFYWGASTASHQVEGNTHNQWTEWELSVATQQAKKAKNILKDLPVWDQIKSEAQDPTNYISGKGVDHYNQYELDISILKKLNLNSFRFGIEWSRVEPEEGVWDKAEWDHYKKYIQYLLDNNIEPFLNIWHWTLPVWFANKGGFSNRKNITYVNRFVSKICEELQIDKLKYVITLNEPNVYASFGYLTGEWPPQVKNPFIAAVTYINLVKVHKSMYRILKKANPKLQIGVAAQLANIQAKRSHNFIDQSVTKIMRYGWNWWFLNRINKYQDFVGFNYYFTDYYKGLKSSNPSVPKNDLGWYMEPEGIYPLLLKVWRHYKKPIIITENGVADINDEHRRWWLEQTMVAMKRAISEGVDLRGYMHWSLLDNFEWAYGWWPKFGLVAVDRKNNMKRTVRSSALWWSEWLQNNK